MSNIRLKTITVEPNTSFGNLLIIKNGNVVINNTTISTNVLTGALNINGGVAINCLYDSASSTSGGALSVGGGISVNNQAFFGNNLTLDNSFSLFKINGISTPRLFLDNVTNKQFLISLDGVTRRLNLQDTNLLINITSESVNATTGALIVNGGISINSTFDSTSTGHGGALSVAGGASFGGNTNIAKTLTIGQNYNNSSGLIVRYTGFSQIGLQNSSGSNTSTINMSGNDLYISNNQNTYFTSTIGSFIFQNSNSGFTLLSINNSNSRFDKWVSITDTIESLNSTLGSLVAIGGISTNCVTDATSCTSGGGVTVAGGLAVNKKLYTGDSVGIELSNNNKNNKIMMYQLDKDLTQTHQFTGFGVSQGSLMSRVPSVNNDHIFYAGISSVNSNEVFRIKGTNEIQFIGSNQKYSFLGGGFNSNSLSIQSQNLSTEFSLNLFTKSNSGNDNIDIKIFGSGLNVTSGNEYLLLGWNVTGSNYLIASNNNGTGINRQLVLQSGISNQLMLSTDGTTLMTTTTQSVNSSIGGLVLLSGGLSINSTVIASSLTQGGGLTINGGLAINKNIYIGTTLNINSNNSNGNIKIKSQNTFGTLQILSPNSNFIYGGISSGTLYNTNMSLYTLNNITSGNYELLDFSFNIANSNYWNITSNAGGMGIIRGIQINTGNFTGISLNTNGNIGINTTLSNYSLDVNGNINASAFSYINGLQIYNTNDAINSTSNGSLLVSGGATINKNFRVNGLVSILNTTDSSSTQGALTISGGITILNGQSSNYGYGALTVAGGAYIGGELYIQQNLNVNGQINGGSSSSSTFAYLTLTATDLSVNLTSGTLLTFGGLTIQCYANSQNVSNGGSLLTPGGASIGKDLYVGGNTFNYGVNDYYASINSLLNFYDTSNILRFSIDRDISSNNFSISRYNSNGIIIEKTIDISNNNGMITINNSTQSLNYSSGSLITMGGITINCSHNANNLGNGGALTVAGGVSIAKRLFVDGDSIFSSTTVSTNSNNGSVLFLGGVGIGGNLNILGDTIVNGNLTIMGSTTSVQSTNVLLNDNILVLNSGPSGSKDSGYLIQRWQNDNDTALGDVIADTPYVTNIISNQSGMTLTQVKLSSSASSIDNAYTGWWIEVTSGFSSNQVRKITGYVGSTKIVTIDSSWTLQNPAIGDSVSLYNKPYVGVIYSEIYDRFEFVSTVSDPTNYISYTDTLPIYFSSATSTSTQSSTSFTQGGIVATGGISTYCTSDSTGMTSGGALSVAGGATILKTLYVGNSIYINNVNITPNTNDVTSTKTFVAANNVITPTNINGLAFTNSWGIDIYLAVQVIANTNYYSNYQIRIVNKGSTWDLISSYVGDQTVTFSITNSGQVQYTCTNFSGFVSSTFKYKAVTN
jgi:hypothetical protein